jgi:hypothetical protein
MKPPIPLLLALLALGLGACNAGDILTGPGPQPGDPAASPQDPDGVPSPNTPETCGNGLDDNGNGDVDENCACKPGESQECFPGQAHQKNQGICRSGVQTCAGTGEFMMWGACENAVGPQPEVCGDGVDQDCDGKDPQCPGKGTCETFTFGQHSRPVDIIWGIDQSGSMAGEIAMVRQNMNAFAAHISGQKIDYRVVVVAKRSGHSRAVCIPQPLAGPSCSDGPRFMQVDQYVDSNDVLEQFMGHMTTINGFLRKGSLRHFVVVTDDESDVLAQTFDAFLQSRPDFKDYVFHSVVGLVDQGCVADQGQQYIALSNQTKGLKFHICNANWQQLFDQLGQNVATANMLYKLTKTPRPGTVKVTINGQPAQPGVDFNYDTAVNQVVLLKQPASGAKIQVCYEV